MAKIYPFTRATEDDLIIVRIGGARERTFFGF